MAKAPRKTRAHQKAATGGAENGFAAHNLVLKPRHKPGQAGNPADANPADNMGARRRRGPRSGSTKVTKLDKASNPSFRTTSTNHPSPRLPASPASSSA